LSSPLVAARSFCRLPPVGEDQRPSWICRPPLATSPRISAVATSPRDLHRHRASIRHPRPRIEGARPYLRRLQSRSSTRPSACCRPPSQPPPSLPPSSRPSVRASSGRRSVWLSARCRPSSGRLSNQVAQQPLPLRPPVVDVLLLPAWVFFLASHWGLCSVDRGCGCSCAALVCSAHI
jgi:hypothetical protein